MTPDYKNSFTNNFLTKLMIYIFLFILVTALLLSLTGCSGTTVISIIEPPITTAQTIIASTTTTNVPTVIATFLPTGVGYDSVSGSPIFSGVLVPTALAIADVEYTVNLYDRRNYVDSTSVGWNQSEINANSSKEVLFPITQSEYGDYHNNNNDLSNFFSVEINTLPAPEYITITSPQYGDIWHVGDKVTITWTSQNISANISLNVVLQNVSGNKQLIGTTANTGSFNWVVTNQILGTNIEPLLGPSSEPVSVVTIPITILAK